MQHINLITRRGFLDRSFKIGLGVALSTLVDIPLVVRRALAEGNIGLNGKKVLFIFLRGANDALNTVIPARDDGMYDLNPDPLNPNYGTSPTVRPSIAIPLERGPDYSASMVDFPESGPTNATFGYKFALRAGNGFAALHPSLKFLAPVLSTGDLAILHRVGYPNQSRSHFDSQRYWENGAPGVNTTQEGIFYRAMIESGLTATSPLTGISFQSALPLLLRGSDAAMTNLSDPLRYDLLGIPYKAGEGKADRALAAANAYPFPAKYNRDLLALQYQNLSQTLDVFGGIDFNETTQQLWDNVNTDGHQPYRLFPTSNATNGGGTSTKYVVDTDSRGYGFFKNLRAAALVLNKTDAIVAGTEVTGWDTHNNQVSSSDSTSGTHANLLRRVGWAMYALQKYFTIYGRGENAPSPGAKVNWDDLIVVTLSEFGRTTVQNGTLGTDHAESTCMFVAGGLVNGRSGTPGDLSFRSGVYGCHPDEYGTGSPLNWATGPTGSMFGVQSRYLKRVMDYRSVLGKIIRDHLGATGTQLTNIIDGYKPEKEGAVLTNGGNSASTPIVGEVPFI